MTTLALRHVAFEDLGLLGPLLERRGHRIRYLDLPQSGATALREAESADLVVVLGGPIGVYETAAYPFLEPEIAVVGRRIEAGGPTLGICLGAQIIAASLRARVYPGGTKEIGWAPVELTAAGRRSVLGPLDEVPGPGPTTAPVGGAAADGAPSRYPVLHWHGDTFDLPAGAELLASTDLYRNQAFSYSGAPAARQSPAGGDGDGAGPSVSMPPSHVLALQFHLEATAEGLESWYVGHTAEIAATPGIEVSSLREAGLEAAAALVPVASKVFGDWLDLLNL